ncbi:unnamed protein product [Amoebophrya sp. A25]|nr:unnamed protein product [Amoebophrya sp. A25]|eukprot:GSA25T00024191001.1
MRMTRQSQIFMTIMLKKSLSCRYGILLVTRLVHDFYLTCGPKRLILICPCTQTNTNGLILILIRSIRYLSYKIFTPCTLSENFFEAVNFLVHSSSTKHLKRLLLVHLSIKMMLVVKNSTGKL